MQNCCMEMKWKISKLQSASVQVMNGKRVRDDWTAIVDSSSE